MCVCVYAALALDNDTAFHLEIVLLFYYCLFTFEDLLNPWKSSPGTDLPWNQLEWRIQIRLLFWRLSLQKGASAFYSCGAHTEQWPGEWGAVLAFKMPPEQKCGGGGKWGDQCWSQRELCGCRAARENDNRRKVSTTVTVMVSKTEVVNSWIYPDDKYVTIMYYYYYYY